MLFDKPIQKMIIASIDMYVFFVFNLLAATSLYSEQSNNFLQKLHG